MLEELEQQSDKSTYPGYTQRGQLGGYITRGDAYYSQGKYDLAISAYKKALEMNPKNVYALKGLEKVRETQSKINQER